MLVVEQPGKLEDIGNLLPCARPMPVEDHRQREVIEPTDLGVAERAGDQDRQERQDNNSQKNDAARQSKPKPPVEPDQDGPGRHNECHGVDRQLKFELKPEPPSELGKLVAQGALLIGERGQVRRLVRDRHDSMVPSA